MCDADEYIKRKPKNDWNLWEIWRRGTMRMLLFAGGAAFAGRGCLEGRLADGDGFTAIVFVLGGAYMILAACKPGKKGGD